MTGEEEDTDVGFPGPGHYIAEREPPMRVAMGILAMLALVGGAIQIPGVDSGITRFLSTTFADSHLARLHDRAADAHDLLPLPSQRPQQPRLHLERVRVDGDDDAAAARPDRLQNRLAHAQAPAQPAVLLVRLEI